MPLVVAGGNVWKEGAGVIVMKLPVMRPETGMERTALGVQALAGVSRMAVGDTGRMLQPVATLPEH